VFGHSCLCSKQEDKCFEKRSINTINELDIPCIGGFVDDLAYPDGLYAQATPTELSLFLQ
jgi:hypothetical protein